MSIIVTAGILLGGLAIIGLLVYMLYANAGYNMKIRIRQVVNGATRVIDDTAKITKDPVDMAKKWKTRKTKMMLPIPPEDALSLTPKGQICAECYVLPNGETQWKFHSYTKDTDKIVENEPFTTEQRQLLVNQYYKALEKKGKGIWDLISNIAPLLICAIVVIFLIIFYEDMGKPLLAMADKVNAHETAYGENLRILQEIKQDIQIIGGDKVAGIRANETALKGGISWYIDPPQMTVVAIS